MKHVKKFNEDLDDLDNYKIPVVRVKDMIEYLSTLDPEMEIILDKDGWEANGDVKNGFDVVSQSSLFHEYTSKSGNMLIINN